MTTVDAAWEQRMAALRSRMDDLDADAFIAEVQAMADELAPGDAVGLFEVASANDAFGREEEAEPRYRRALEAGLGEERRRRAVIQLASTIRNLGQAQESVALLTAERERGSDELDDAVTAFLALALIDTGREREAASLALTALSRHLPRYNRSLANYARLTLAEPGA